MTQNLPVGDGYGRANATTSETFIVDNLPAGYLFWAFDSTRSYIRGLSSDQTPTPYIVQIFQDGVLLDTDMGGPMCGKLPLTGGSISFEVYADSPGYYSIGWGHSELDTNPDHWQDVTPDWVPFSMPRSSNGKARQGSLAQSYGTGSPYPVDSSLEQALYDRASSGETYATTSDAVWSSDSVGYSVRSELSSGRTVRVKKQQAGQVFEYAEPVIPEKETYQTLKYPWGSMPTAAGSTEAGGWSLQLDATLSRTITAGGQRILSPTVELRALEGSSYVQPDVGVSDMEQDPVYDPGTNHFSSRAVGWQTGVGSEIFSHSFSDEGNDDLYDPANNVTYTQANLPDMMAFAALDLTDPAGSKQYIAISMALSSTDYPAYFSTAQDATTTDEEHFTASTNLKLYRDFKFAPHKVYKGFPLFGVLKVLTSSGWLAIGMAREVEDTYVERPGRLMLQTGTQWATENSYNRVTGQMSSGSSMQPGVGDRQMLIWIDDHWEPVTGMTANGL